MNETHRKVYVPNKGGHDYSAAEDYGDLVFITEGQVNRFATGRIYRDVMHALEDATPDDWVMDVGPSMAVVITAACFARKFGTLNMLLFRDGEYVARNLDIDSLMEA